MSPVERRGFITYTRSNNIEVAHVPGRDCVHGVTAMAVNTLTKSPTRVTRENVAQVIKDTHIDRGQYNDVLDAIAAKHGISDIISWGIEYAFTDADTFQFYTDLIDHECLVIVNVDGPKWYHAIGYPNEVEDVGHQMLLTGYTYKEDAFFHTRSSESVVIKDTNIREQFSVKYKLLRSVMYPELKSVIVFFQNKQNTTVGKIKIP